MNWELLLHKIIVLDTETTSVGKNDVVIELGYIKLPELITLQKLFTDLPLDLFLQSFQNNIYEERFFPPVPINRQAMAIHGIQLKDLFGKRKSSELTLPDGVEYIIAHNVIFDLRLISQSNPSHPPLIHNSIDTMVLSKLLKKNLNLPYENNKLSTLTEHFYPNDYLQLTPTYHSAVSDCKKTILVLLKLLSHLPHITTWESLFTFQQTTKNN